MSLPSGDESDSNSSYLLALQSQISQHQYDHAQLRASRQKFIIATLLSWAITLTTVYMYQTQKTAALKATTASIQTRPQLAVKNQAPISTTDVGSLDDAEIYLKKVKDALAGKQPTRQATNRKGTSQSKRPLHSSDTEISISGATRKDILRLIYQWEIAWELKDTTAFFSYYSHQFNPGWKSSNMEEWKKRKRYLINSPEWIKIDIGKIRIIEKTDATVTVTFDQHYQKPGYSDFTRKRLQLTREDKQWKIIRESGASYNIDL